MVRCVSLLQRPKSSKKHDIIIFLFFLHLKAINASSIVFHAFTPFLHCRNLNLQCILESKVEGARMGLDSNQISNMGFKRYEHWFMGGNVTEWMDKRFPNCPLCKKPSLWELGNSAAMARVQSAWKNNMRNYFRCPNCMGIISVDIAIVQKKYFVQSLFKEQNARIENEETTLVSSIL